MASRNWPILKRWQPTASDALAAGDSVARMNNRNCFKLCRTSLMTAPAVIQRRRFVGLAKAPSLATKTIPSVKAGDGATSASRLLPLQTCHLETSEVAIAILAMQTPVGHRHVWPSVRGKDTVDTGQLIVLRW